MKTSFGRKSFFWELGITLVCFAVACLGIFFYLRQFRPWEAPASGDKGNAEYVRNYEAVPIRTQKLERKKLVTGQIGISEDSLRTLSVQSTAIRGGESFSVGTALGSGLQGDIIRADCNGFVLAVDTSASGESVLEYLDFNQIDVLFRFENSYQDAVAYGRDFPCRIGARNVSVQLKSISVDVENGGFYGLFRFVGTEALYVYQGETCILELGTEEFWLPCVQASFFGNREIHEGDIFRWKLTDGKGFYENRDVTVAVIGENLVGLSAADPLEGLYICNSAVSDDD